MYTDITGYHSQDGREVKMNMILLFLVENLRLWYTMNTY